MSYGTINSDGSINTNYSFSNDFIVSQGSNTGTYVITFLEWMGSMPALTITPINSNPNDGYSAVYAIDKDSHGRYRANIALYHKTDKANEAFGFVARFGHTLTFTAPTTLTLDPSVISFGSPSTQVLVVSTTISLAINGSTTSFTAQLDKGTALMGVGSRMTLSLSASSVTSGRNTWDLQGYTYGGGSDATGTPWNGTSYTLPILSNEGPATTPELFVIKGTPRPGNEDQSTLSTDPLVRLTNVPPGGLAM